MPGLREGCGLHLNPGLLLLCQHPLCLLHTFQLLSHCHTFCLQLSPHMSCLRLKIIVDTGGLLLGGC